jgi:hypothetical protein
MHYRRWEELSRSCAWSLCLARTLSFHGIETFDAARARKGGSKRRVHELKHRGEGLAFTGPGEGDRGVGTAGKLGIARVTGEREFGLALKKPIAIPG